MIERLQIRNFQPHTDRTIEFDPLVTVIVGLSDCGKSSIVRALRWVCINEPSGDAFLQDGKKRCGAALHVDGRVIRRIKASGENSYKFDAQRYEAIGKAVPEAVANFLNLSPVSWQGQHDAPFWLSSTAGQVGRELNAIVNLELIDRVLLETNRIVVRERQREELIGEKLKKAKAEVEELEWVDEAKLDFDDLEDSHTCCEEAATQAERMSAVCLNATKMEELAEEIDVVLHVAEKVVVAGLRLEELEEQIGNLDGIIEQAERSSRIEAPDFSGVEEAWETIEKQRERCNRLDKLIQSIESSEAAADDADEQWESAENQLAEETEGRCPLCGAEMKEARSE